MHAICVTCGTQFRDTPDWPAACSICDDDRQFMGLDGQRWTALEDLRRDYSTLITEEEPGLTAFSIEPRFGIGQRAFLVCTPDGNLLWDSLSLLDNAALACIRAQGGLSAIAISHPHYYTCMIEWSAAFGDIPIYLHAADKQWVMRPDRRILFWRGETQDLPGGLKLIRCGGHFAGASVLHWPQGAAGRGALLSADTIQVAPNRKFVSFMYSYPNYIPLNAAAVTRVVAAVQPFAFDRIYGAFPGMTIAGNAKQILERSAYRYLKAIAPE